MLFNQQHQHNIFHINLNIKTVNAKETVHC